MVVASDIDVENSGRIAHGGQSSPHRDQHAPVPRHRFNSVEPLKSRTCSSARSISSRSAIDGGCRGGGLDGEVARWSGGCPCDGGTELQERRILKIHERHLGQTVKGRRGEPPTPPKKKFGAKLRRLWTSRPVRPKMGSRVEGLKVCGPSGPKSKHMGEIWASTLEMPHGWCSIHCLHLLASHVIRVN